MTRRAKVELKTVNVRIPPELHDRLNDAAERRVVGVSLLVRNAIDQYLDELPPIPGEVE